MTPLVCGDRTRVRTWRSSGSSPAKAVLQVSPRKQGPLSDTRAIGAGTTSMISPVVSSTSSMVSRGTQIVETKHALGFGDGRVQASESVGAAGRWSDGGGEAEPALSAARTLGFMARHN